tara:strand:- start:21107 stop:21409 length:303 start_codon:yes stop_codon:yes gene_type:complete
MNEYMLATGIAVFAIGFGLRIYQKMNKQWKEAMADGEISLEEALALVSSAQQIIEEIETLPSLSKMKSMKKAELVSLCEKHGVDSEGTKAVLLEKLKGMA